MAKLYALKTILRQTDAGKDEVIMPRTVFDAEPAQARQLMALDSARNATKAEIGAAEALQAKRDGTAIA